MGKTKHNKIALRVPTYCVTAKERKDYQDNERPKTSQTVGFTNMVLMVSGVEMMWLAIKAVGMEKGHIVGF